MDVCRREESMCGEGENRCVEKGRMDVWRRGEWMCGEGENGCAE